MAFSGTARTFIGFDRISSTCSSGLRGYIVTGIIVRFLRYHFATDANIVNPELRQYIWNDDFTQTNILIEDATIWDRRNMQMRPALIVRRNAMGFVKIGLNDGMQLGNELIDGDYADTAEYSKLCGGSHTVFAIAKSGREAEGLAEEAGTALLFLSPVIRNEFDFKYFTVAQIGGISKLRESSEHWVVPITIAWNCAISWSITAVGPVLKQIDIQVEPN